MDGIDVSLSFLEFPRENMCDGKNQSPEIKLKGVKAEAIAIMVYNPSLRKGFSYAAWLIWNLPPVELIPAGIPHGKLVTEPISAVQGKNDEGEPGYTGPCPPPGEAHRYLFRVYGLDEILDLAGGATKYQLNAAMSGHIVQYGETEGVSTR